MEESSDRIFPERISRRRIIKRGAAGAAVAWTAPVLMSLRTPAFAASPSCDTFDCSKLPCTPSSSCSNHQICTCLFATKSDGCVCVSHYVPGQDCTSDADCPVFPGFSPGMCASANNCAFPGQCLYCIDGGARERKELRRVR
jgi:hypothetical protein